MKQRTRNGRTRLERVQRRRFAARNLTLSYEQEVHATQKRGGGVTGGGEALAGTLLGVRGAVCSSAPPSGSSRSRLLEVEADVRPALRPRVAEHLRGQGEATRRERRPFQTGRARAGCSASRPGACCAVVGRALYMMLRYCSELLSSTALQKAEPAVPDRLFDSRLRYSMDEFAQRAVARAMAPSSEIWLRARSSRVSLVECFRNSAIRIASTSVYSSLSHSSSSSSRSSPTCARTQGP